jgi:hypothetical protein
MEQSTTILNEAKPSSIFASFNIVVLCSINIQYTYIVGKYKIYLYEL